jgi:hypothetical protein
MANASAPALSLINGISATVIACLACGMQPSAIVAKVCAKYRTTPAQASAMVSAIAGLGV